MKMKTTVRALVLLMGMAATSSAIAAKTKVAVNLNGSPTTEPMGAQTPPNASEVSKNLEEAEARGNRTVAAAEFSDSSLSESFKSEIRKRANAATTPDKLIELLNFVNDDAKYAKLAPDAQFAAAQLAPMIVFNGIVNRMYELVEPNKIVHMSVVSSLRSLGAGVMAYSSTPKESAAVLQFLTVPRDSMKAPIDTEEKFHAFLETELAPALEKAKNRIYVMNFKTAPVYFDTQLFTGSENYSNDQDRYIRMGEAERQAAVANLFYSISSIQSLTAYNLSGLFGALDEMSTKFGLNTVLYRPENTMDHARFDILRRWNKKSGLFNLRPGGQKWMNDAYQNLENSVAASTFAWAEVRNHLNDNSMVGNLIDSRSASPITRMMQTGLNHLSYIAFQDDQYTAIDRTTKKHIGGLMNAVVAGDVLKVNLANFYHAAPANLTELFPTEFNKSPYVVTGSYKGKSRTYRDFLAGRATAWDVTEYNKLFGDKDHKIESKDIPTIGRELSQTWGGWFIGVPLNSLIL
jgi:hypothetical protein